MKEKAEMKSVLMILVLLALAVQVLSESIVPQDLCKLYVGSEVFNLTGLREHDSVTITLTKDKKYTIVSSMCSPLNVETLKEKYPSDRREKVKYTGNSELQPNLLLIDESKPDGFIEISDLAYLSPDKLKDWRASYEKVNQADNKELLSAESPALEIAYNISNNEKATEIGIAEVVLKYVCVGEEDFEFFDERLVGATLVFQYNGKKACTIRDKTTLDSNWNLALFLLICISTFGLFLDRENERLALTLGSMQGAAMTVVGVYIACGFKSGTIPKETEVAIQILSFAFGFLVVGLSYFSRYVCLFFVCIASSFAMNCITLYLFALIFQVMILPSLFYIGGVIFAGMLLTLMWYSHTFREKYSFTIVSATTNAFYLCACLGYATNYAVNILTFNKFKQFGKVESIEFKHWVFFLVWVAITVVVVTFRVQKASKSRKEAMAKNAGLFKRFSYGVGIDGYIEPEDDPATVIAM